MPEPFAEVSSFYTELFGRFGHDNRSLDYNTPAAQADRFAVLAGVTDLTGRSVLDVGCGFADWYDWLEANVGDVRYRGIDITAAFLEQARANHPGLDLRVANILDDEVEGSYDVVAANGIFYLLGDDAPSLMRQIVTKMFGLCTGATVFTSLSTWGSLEPGEFGADPAEVLTFCRTLTPWVTLRHDYHHRDFAVYLYRDRPA